MGTTRRGGTRLYRVFETTCDRTPSATALECGPHTLTYAELDARANRLAHHLRGLGVGAGSRVALLLPRSVDLYAALLAVGKAGATFVPIDPAAPADRVAFIASDARVDAVLTVAGRAGAVAGLGAHVVELDTRAAELAAAPATRPRGPAPARAAGPPGPEDDDPADPLAYIMYTSGSSGRPKGVAVAHSSICNFLAVVPGVYDVRPEDRVYQGMTVSFDFSIEEIWPTWAVGATLVAGPAEAGAGRFGAELADTLDELGITVLYCVPTLLATVPRDLPGVRALMVGGEACPARLVERWSRPGRRILNTYGPTETTVTATVAELRPGRPVTIGRPLPTYTVVLLDEERRPVPDGAVGEICVGGPGVARGYVGRPELTAERFVAHPLAPGGGRLYRTGDLGRVTADGEIAFLGRADDEVKVRGYRVDLGEIDNVLLEDPGVAEAATALVRLPARDGEAEDEEGAGECRELSAYVVPSSNYGASSSNGDGPADAAAADALVARLHQLLRQRLPAYMVPPFLDVLPRLPAMPSGKVDRRRLPAPTGRRLGGGGPVVPPRGEVESRVREVWAEVFGMQPDTLSTEADFFDDLGGHSLLAAQVVSLLRSRGVGSGTGATLRALYAHPTVRGLAAGLDAAGVPEALPGNGDGADGGPGTAGTGSAAASPPPVRPRPLRHSRARIAVAGLVQAAALYLLLFATTLPLAIVFGRQGGVFTSRTPVPVQPVLAVLVGYAGVRWLLPVLLARPLAAGVRPGRYPLWGPTYLRLWTLGLLLSVSPLPALSGSPLAGGYLRLLGARIGPRTTIATGGVPLPSLVRIGADASIGYGVTLHAWRVADGWVTVAPIDIGPRAYVGAHAVLEPGARVETGAGLGEQSVLGEGDAVPPGARWAGSPPSPVPALTPDVEEMLRAGGPAERGRVRHLAAALLGVVLLELLALAVLVPGAALVWCAWLAWGSGPAVLVSLVLAAPLYVLSVCAAVAGAKRLVLRRTPVGSHPVRSGLGVRKWLSDKLLESSLALTNSLYATLYTAPWLRLLGARIGPGAEVSTASHLDPDLLVLGEGSFVADMAGVGGAAFAGGRVLCRRTEVGRRAFVGNAAYLPAGTRTGPHSLIGVGTVPAEEEVPPGSFWLGSPAFRLPRRQSSGTFPEELTFRPTRRAVRRRLAVEYFRATMPAALLGTTAYLFLLALSGVAHSPSLALPVLLAPVLLMAAGLAVVAACALLKWLVVGRYRPRVEPLWSWFVRRTEFVTGLYEAAAVPAGLAALAGTPFLPPALRLFGARIGRRTWLATTFLTEFDLVEVGDDAAIGAGVSLQTHLFEDRVMKMSKVTVRAGAGVGSRAIILYDGTVGEGVWLDALSLVMKGEYLLPGTAWRGIPAQGLALRPADRPSAAPAPHPTSPAR
ncbi:MULTISPECIES: Pls/PosA family non-ribosomal peptide synthetase [unclassified Streptomyces]|uniref:Pls/PosA family non-ribosomal peptide synthetase n=1 Tax=unclassified Streptomyces TaxID=2593676 RepID=UPI00036A01DB|nr:MULTISPECIES: Pls/PosA family non-ribosomal peptide synthetase [unclassified Streptomyces]MYT33272.1 amino acid adenylation domain-containing protein [Streptomyces sp. SID8354]